MDTVKPDLARQFRQRFYRKYRAPIWAVIIASALVNILTFGASLYLLVVYDLILPSGSIPTLLSLFGMLTVAYAFQGLFDIARGSALRSIAARLHAAMSPRLHYALANRPLRKGRTTGDGVQPMRDLDQIYSYVSGPGPAALIDLPWVLIFLLALTILHIWLGIAAVFGVCIMAAIAWMSSRRTKQELDYLGSTVASRNLQLQTEIRMAETSVAMGMLNRLSSKGQIWDEQFRTEQGRFASIVGRFGGVGRVFRMFVQSLILTVGAMLVIVEEASAGIIIAASVLAGRALAPVDTAISTWRAFESSRKGWAGIVDAITETSPPSKREVTLAPPENNLALQDVWVVPPGATDAVVQGVSISLVRGQALALIGPSGAGKTSLVKAILGIWESARGEVRLDGALHSQWDQETIGNATGYVPQIVDMIEGTIAENISRFDPEATSERIKEAAEKAGMHSTILAMDEGYETRLGTGGLELSAGQRQRLGLARAVYGRPFLLVLDEPNSNLDSDGDEALTKVIAEHRKAAGIVVMVTHRSATLGPISHVAAMTNGRLTKFGKRDDVLTRPLSSPVDVPPNKDESEDPS